jgi:hypothetical protein
MNVANSFGLSACNSIFHKAQDCGTHACKLASCMHTRNTATRRRPASLPASTYQRLKFTIVAQLQLQVLEVVAIEKFGLWVVFGSSCTRYSCQGPASLRFQVLETCSRAFTTCCWCCKDPSTQCAFAYLVLAMKRDLHPLAHLADRCLNSVPSTFCVLFTQASPQLFRCNITTSMVGSC